MSASAPEVAGMAPAVSIVIRSFGRAALLPRTLAAVAAQSFGDWELIVVNDGGDGAAVAQALRAAFGEDARVRLLDHPCNRGRWPAAATGLAAARGEFLALLDDDDAWEPGFLAATVAHLRDPANRGHVAVCAGWCRRHERREPDGTLTVVSAVTESFGQGEVPVSRFLRGDWNVPPSATLYRRAAIEAAGGFDDTLPVAGDWEMNLRLLAHGRFGAVAEVLALWSLRPEAVGSDEGNSVHSGAHAVWVPVVKERMLGRAIARDEATVGQLLWLGPRLDALGDGLHAALAAVAGRLDGIEQQLAAIGARSDALAGEIDAAVARIAAIEALAQRSAAAAATTERAWDALLPLRRIVARLRGRAPPG
jgi:glycosyltransferase involved in cell wall biosynthesis